MKLAISCLAAVLSLPLVVNAQWVEIMAGADIYAEYGAFQVDPGVNDPSRVDTSLLNLDATKSAPGSSVAGSYHISFTAGENGAFSDPGTEVVLANLNPATFRFDYQMTGDVNQLFQFSLTTRVGHPAGTHLRLTPNFNVNLQETTGDEWLTAEVDISDWTADFYNSAAAFSSPHSYGITVHNASWVGGAGELWIDNVRMEVVPEPSTYAAIAGLLVLGLAIWRRRRK